MTNSFQSGFLRDASGALVVSGGEGTVVQTTPENYGAARDGVTDDTQALRDAINNAVANCITDGSFYCEVLLSAGTYLLSGALVQGGATNGNAQVPLPIVAPTAEKVTLVLKGVRETGAFPHWQQTVAQKAGAVLKSSLTGQAYSATHGLPSIIGGPTPEHGYATTGALFNNLCVVVDGVVVMAPQNPSVCGVDLRGVAAARIGILACQADQTPPTAIVPTNVVTGLMMPVNGNNDYCEIGRYTCEGWYRGVLLGEHTNAVSIGCVYCYEGLCISGPNGHGAHVAYASIEACKTALRYVDITPVAYGAPGAPLVIDLLDYEQGVSPFTPTYFIDDVSNKLYGEMNYVPNNANLTGKFHGGVNFRARSTQQGPAPYTAPAVPASGTALTNPTGRDAIVYVTGGTVTGISVAGGATGMTGGAIYVPAWQTITLTYSVAPSWAWIAL